jgi:hypothetical protein
MSAGAQRLLTFMVETARFRDRIYFASDSTAAKALGVSRQTAFKWRCQLEEDGYIKRIGKRRCGWGKHTVCYRFTQRTSCHTSKTTKPSGFSACARGRRRRMMENHPARLNEGLVRRNGEITPYNAGDVVAAVVDIFAEQGIPLAGRFRGMLGRHAKDLLDSGFDYFTVVTAAVMAFKRGVPQHTTFIAQDLVMARAGAKMTRAEYERAIEDELEIRRRERRDENLGN